MPLTRGRLLRSAAGLALAGYLARGIEAADALAALAPAPAPVAVPVGSVLHAAPGWCPPGFLPCDGQPIDRSLYPDLHALLGRHYSGRSWPWRRVRVPDFRGRVAGSPAPAFAPGVIIKT
jgi:hypothetical protein